MKVLGLSALYHDAAAVLVEDGVIIAAAQEERFTRIKHDKCIPICAIKFCLSEGKCSFSDLDVVVYYDNPLLTIQRFCKNICTLQNKSDDLLNRKGCSNVVICGGVAGYRSSEELFKLIRDGFDFKPDIVLNYSGFNDLYLQEYPYINFYMKQISHY